MPAYILRNGDPVIIPFRFFSSISNQTDVLVARIFDLWTDDVVVLGFCGRLLKNSIRRHVTLLGFGQFTRVLGDTRKALRSGVK